MINDAHGMQITCCAFNEARRELFSGGQDALIKVWDVESGKLLRTLTGHSGWVTDLLFVRGAFPAGGSGTAAPPSSGTHGGATAEVRTRRRASSALAAPIQIPR